MQVNVLEEGLLSVLARNLVKGWRTWQRDVSARLRRGPGFRERIVGRLAGRVLEIGFGYGDNLPHYRRASAVWAIEPSASGLAEARRLAGQVNCPIMLNRAVAEALPFADASFDAAVATLVFCSVGDPSLAFRELRRVLRSGGTLHLFEHVRSPYPWLAWLQDRFSSPWERVSGGCHLNRDTIGALRAAGFEVTRVRRFVGGVFVAVQAALPQ